jgi:hypothetical protein
MTLGVFSGKPYLKETMPSVQEGHLFPADVCICKTGFAPIDAQFVNPIRASSALLPDWRVTRVVVNPDMVVLGTSTGGWGFSTLRR